MSASTPHVLLRDEIAGRGVAFAAPRAIVSAETPEALDDAFARLEAARAAGQWLAGYVAYEAGYVLEPALAGLLPAGRRGPLLRFGVFDAPLDAGALPPPPPANPLCDATPAWDAARYGERFARLHEHIRRGDCYQANLTFPIHARWTGDPAGLFGWLAARQPVGHAALVALGDPVIVSRSPELFFTVDADGWIDTRPMKGTARRGATAEADRAVRDALAADPKNQAENRMIVDLLRNDISLVSDPATLDVPELFRVETYATLHQMVSRVRARLLPGLSLRRLFAALFPSGSITGAPKISAMSILRRLEDEPREAYCGAIGWIEPSGRMRFNVAIRTISLYGDGSATFNVGGGIVYDSRADSEYGEALLKARYALA